MGLPIYVGFQRFRESSPSLAAHVHIGRVSNILVPRKPVLLDKGIARCPIDLDLAYSDIASHLVDEGKGADVFLEALSPNTDLRLDVFLERTNDGVTWSSEKLLARCCCGGSRQAEIPELSGNQARIRIRAISPRTPTARVRIWANEPRRVQRSPVQGV